MLETLLSLIDVVPLFSWDDNGKVYNPSFFD
jgi:hypothetical protein